MEEFSLGRLLLLSARESCALVCSRLAERGYAVRFAHSALMTNLDEDGTRLTTLAERAGMSKQAMGVLAKELEAAGYLWRDADPTDARAILIKLTPRGRELMHSMIAEMTRIENEVRVLLGDEDMKTMRRCLNALLRGVSEHRGGQGV